MINTNAYFKVNMSPWRNIFHNAHKFYRCTDCYNGMNLIEMFKWNYEETPAFEVRKV